MSKFFRRYYGAKSMINEQVEIESRKLQRALDQLEACSRTLRGMGLQDEAKFVETASGMVNAHHYELIENYGPVVRTQI